MSSYQSCLERCEAAVRDGQGHVVPVLIAALNLARIPRTMRLPLAHVCRRAQLLSVALRILTPVIREAETNRHSEPATPAEIAEYAVLLTRLGAVREAIQWLGRVDPQILPSSQLYRAFCHFSVWDYNQALPVLERYLESDLEPYQRLIGQVNLAACLVAVAKFDRAMVLLTETLAQVKEGRHRRLEGNCRELRAQIHIQRGHVRRARADLDHAAAVFGAERTLDELFVRKWRAVMSARELGSAQPLIDFREEAASRGDSESTREADLHLLPYDEDDSRFDCVLFGTPFPFYRQRILDMSGRQPSRSEYRFGDQASSSFYRLATGETNSGLKQAPGSAAHRLMAALLRDFYRPLRIAGLFAELYPGEAFDIFTSPDRVHQVLRRCRRDLARAGVPARIVSENAGLRLKVDGAFCFVVPLEPEPVDRQHLWLARLKSRYGAELFDARDAQELLGVSASSIKRFARWARDCGAILPEGRGRATRYRLCNASESEPT